MYSPKCIFPVLLLAAWSVAAGAAVVVSPVVVIEPDDYAEGTVLNTIVPEVTLGVTTGPGIQSPAFPVTANSDAQGFAPTGTFVFGQANVPFFNPDRRLQMQFHGEVGIVSIDFAHPDFFGTHSGVLEIYNADEVLLDTLVSAPVGTADGPLTMTLSRAEQDIAWAVAWSEGPFGRLDNLRFVPIPEPAALSLAALGLAGCVLRRSRR
ncbi:MAG: PEP-CTERM sorting domain-containing protein [Akkermansiaceae bacterium]|nr:PEP-CTERM sorting domain-containing protein [Akkermansiaceae bacterium]NNM29531.1 PEP-CTERM sorting domain-containing protein [Akkermansiaceae bacterium]